MKQNGRKNHTCSKVFRLASTSRPQTAEIDLCSFSPHSDFDVMGSLDVLDSRFSSVNLEQSWSLGVVYKRVKNLDIGIVANAKAEVGLGIGINLPMVSIQIGEKAFDEYEAI